MPRACSTASSSEGKVSTSSGRFGHFWRGARRIRWLHGANLMHTVSHGIHETCKTWQLRLAP